MLFISLFKWWYGEGWRQRAVAINGRLEGVVDYFSIDLLLKTLFSPFRQISAGRVDGPIGEQLRAFADKMVSRVIGGFVRSIILLTGLVTIALMVIISLLLLVLWAVVPTLPLVGIVLAVIGWTPV